MSQGSHRGACKMGTRRIRVREEGGGMTEAGVMSFGDGGRGPESRKRGGYGS